MGANDKLHAAFHPEATVRPSHNDSTQPGAAYHPHVSGDRRQKVVREAGRATAEIDRPYVPRANYYLLLGASMEQAKRWARENDLYDHFRGHAVVTSPTAERLRGVHAPVVVVVRDTDFRPFTTQFTITEIRALELANMLNATQSQDQYVMPIDEVLTQVASGFAQFMRRLEEQR